MAAQGVLKGSIAATLGRSSETMIVWRTRYLQAGIAGLEDLPRSCQPPVIDDLEAKFRHWIPMPRSCRYGLGCREAPIDDDHHGTTSSMNMSKMSFGETRSLP